MLHPSDRSRVVSRAAALIVLALAAPPAGAQVYASEHALAQQTANGTIITVEYYRPVAHGRELFGALVKWGRTWTPGANWATTLDVDHDVTVEGQPLPKGKYSVWAVPQPDAWTVILSRKARAFHMMPPPAEDEQLRLTAKPAQGPHVETLTWSFPVVTKEGVDLHMQWGTLDLPLHLGVAPSSAVTAMSAEERARYVGAYHMTPAAGSRAQPSTFVVFDSAGVLRLRRPSLPDMFYDPQFDLFRRPDGTFQPIMYKKGVLVGIEPAFTIVFSFAGERASGMELRVQDGAVVALSGVREGP